MMKKNLLSIVFYLILLFGLVLHLPDLSEARIITIDSSIDDIKTSTYITKSNEIYTTISPEGVYQRGESYVTDPTKYDGYIIELKEKPVLEYKKDLQNKVKENRIEIEKIEKEKESVSWYNVPGHLTNMERSWYIKRKELEIKKIDENLPSLLKDRKNKIENLHKRLETDLASSLASITGRVTAEKKQSKIMGKYKKVFSGMAVNITDAEANEVKKLDYVKDVYPNYEVHTTLMDSVPLINADDVWDLGYTGEGMTIAIIDTGIDYTHSDLGSCFGDGCKVISGYDFVNDDNDPMDDHGHGTHCAGIAASNGTLKGVAPDAKLLAYKVLNASGSGTWSQVISGIERSVDPNNDGDFSDHADVISMSLGGSGNPDDPVSRAVDNAVDAGVVAVIAAGNGGPREQSIRSPGTARKAITVGATDKYDSIAYFSSRGPVTWKNDIIIKPDIVAPGRYICSAQWDDAWADKECFDDKHTEVSGTSMATPHVAGAVALLKQKNPDWTPEEIKRALRNTAVDLHYSINEQGYGRIDVLEAIQLTSAPPIASIDTSGKISGTAVDIIGTATSDNFKEYRLYYTVGNYVSDVRPSNRTVVWFEICNSNNPVIDNVLCNWDIKTLSADYALKLVVNSETRQSVDYVFVYIVAADLQKGWPIDYTVYNRRGPSYIYHIPAVEDLNGDGYKEVIVGGQHGMNIGILSTFTYNGNMLSGWPQYIDTSPDYGVAVGDINQDGLKEVVTTFDFHSPKIHVYDLNGNLVWMQKMRDYSGELGCVTLDDINKDGYSEIITQSRQGKMLVLDYLGNNLTGWPQDLPEYDIRVRKCVSTADFDGDGYKEIVFSLATGPIYKKGDLWVKYRGGVGVFNYDGSLRWFKTWPNEITTEYFHYAVFTSPVIADVNADGQLDIILGHGIFEANDYNDQYYRNRYLVLDKDGNTLPGWPIDVEIVEGNRLYGNRSTDPGNLLHGPVVANLDDDPELEIIGQGRKSLYVWNHDGSLFFPPVELYYDDQNESLIGGPAVADVTGDKLPDIIVASQKGCAHRGCDNTAKLYIINNSGTIYMDGWPKLIHYDRDIRVNTPIITDIDIDGDSELIFEDERKIYVWDLKTNYSAASSEWPMFHHDPHHTGLYGYTIEKPEIITCTIPSSPTCKTGSCQCSVEICQNGWLRARMPDNKEVLSYITSGNVVFNAGSTKGTANGYISCKDDGEEYSVEIEVV